MRIKFKDKIYRLKEIESGVDSLMELVEEPKHKYKEGDFLTTASGSCFILKNICGSKVYDHAFLGENWIDWDNGHCCYLDDITGYCTPEERSKVIAALKKDGKRWNAEEKKIETLSLFKDGDVVFEDGRIMIFKSLPYNYHALFNLRSGIKYFDGKYGENFTLPTFRFATEEEKQQLFDALAKEGKRWNAEKKCIEDIPQRKFKVGDKVALKSGCTSNIGLIYLSHFDEYIGKELTVYDYTESGNVICNNGFRFAEDWLELYVEKQQPKFKAGDKVRIKDGISSKTHRNVFPHFTELMDKFIGKELTVKKYNRFERVVFYEDDWGYNFAEDWLEPCTEELKNGDLAIFWDNNKALAFIKIYDRKYRGCHYDNSGVNWDNAIKFESKEQFEKVIKGEI